MNIKETELKEMLDKLELYKKKSRTRYLEKAHKAIYSELQEIKKEKC